MVGGSSTCKAPIGRDRPATTQGSFSKGGESGNVKDYFLKSCYQPEVSRGEYWGFLLQYFPRALVKL